MVSVADLQSFLQAQGADFSESRLASCIARATTRAKNILGVDTLPETESINQAVLLLAASELAPEINLYYKGKENITVLRTKDIVAEAERLLGVVPDSEPMKWI